jgi:ABC-type antimicrobial peptide transport system permease subunit
MGIAIGLITGWLLARVFAGEPFYLQPLDPATYGLVILLFLATTSGAALLPVWRALRKDPRHALRHE